eukprot:CAMPEP_0119108198 /NCGR_PEP_ID=MMETSP1180-20130426/13521_1 /TAXON_ID=3052 ORGANISM="Chlamydomonas cf sp, Strain CCMP681" /NCGR_SAMPLE_ID=MMETSP1180 /ASSEMBLY_ACC=CAM_ASM_000741 /LENGTH=359 /DNA_ID=CAMNT_0007093789 /DNA_START=297 /DNA_END=1377 /DNA_ORIENTATION=-
MTPIERAALAMISSAIQGQVAPEIAAREVAAALSKSIAASARGVALQQGGEETMLAQEGQQFAAAEAAIKLQGAVPEVVFGPGKSPDQIAQMMQSCCKRQRMAMATRIEPEMYAAVRMKLPGVEYNARARLLTLHSPIADQLPKTERLPGSVAVVSGGSQDQSIAEECRLLAEHLGCFCFRLPDVGLGNGLGRLLNSLAALRAADVVVVVCGLDGALASVVAGVVDAPVVAVPTSSGYGATMGGAAPLLAQLSCTTPGVTVVNIDNGFGAAMASQKMLKMAYRLHQSQIAQRQSAAVIANDFELDWGAGCGPMITRGKVKKGGGSRTGGSQQMRGPGRCERGGRGMNAELELAMRIESS